MKAKDTVMSKGEIEIAIDKGYKEFEKDMNLMTLSDQVKFAIAKAQAKISFKAGIREVVEEYSAARACTHMVGYHYLADCKECLRDKLEEWEVK